MNAIILRITSFLMSFFAVFSATTIPIALNVDPETSITMVVNEKKLSERYQNGFWNGEHLSGFGHEAEVKNGCLIVDGKRSIYPADSSVMNESIPVCPGLNGQGTWFEDHERNEIRYDEKGKSIFTFYLQDAVTVKDINVWTTRVEGDKMYVFNGDGSRITIVDMSGYGVLSSTYGLSQN